MKILLAALFLFCSASFSYALDWHILHEQADQLSLAQAQEAVARNPASLEKIYVLGLVYLNLHRDKEAAAAFDKALILDPKALEAEWGKAEVLRRQHDLKKSEEALQEIIKQSPDFAPAYISLAYIRYIQLDFNQAVSLASKVIDERQNNVDPSNYVRAILIVSGAKGMLAHYGGFFSKLTNGTAVFPGLKKAEKLKPDDAGVLFGMGSFYLLAPKIAGGNLQKAKIYLERTIKADPLFADAYVRLAEIYKLEGDDNKYRLYLNKALEIDPGNDLALDVKSGACKLICIEKQGL